MEGYLKIERYNPNPSDHSEFQKSCLVKFFNEFPFIFCNKIILVKYVLLEKPCPTRKHRLRRHFPERRRTVFRADRDWASGVDPIPPEIQSATLVGTTTDVGEPFPNDSKEQLPHQEHVECTHFFNPVP